MTKTKAVSGKGQGHAGINPRQRRFLRRVAITARLYGLSPSCNVF